MQIGFCNGELRKTATQTEPMLEGTTLRHWLPPLLPLGTQSLLDICNRRTSRHILGAGMLFPLW
jgi:hypothetical protein